MNSKNIFYVKFDFNLIFNEMITRENLFLALRNKLSNQFVPSSKRNIVLSKNKKDVGCKSGRFMLLFVLGFIINI